jgi:hypothetical protein
MLRQGKPEVCNAVVAFIDFLGQSEIMLRMPTMPTSHRDAEKAAKTVNRTSILTRKLRYALSEAFEHLAASAAEDTRWWPKPFEKYAQQKPRYSVYGFADTIIMALPLEPDDHPFRVVHALEKFFMAISGFVIVCLSDRLLPRGALECGMIQIFPDGEISGAAVAEAHQMESRVASYPRIVVGGGFLALCQALRDLARDLPTKEQKEIVLNGLRLLVANLEPDIENDTVSFDYLGLFLASELSSLERRLVIDAHGFVRAEAKRITKTGDEKLMYRCYRLKDYFDRHLGQ